MRKITEQAVAAFQAGRHFTSNNTDVYRAGPFVVMALFGNPIAKRLRGKLYICAGGYHAVPRNSATAAPISMTTKERLNGLPGVQVWTDRKILYLNGDVWEDQHSWTEVKS